MHSLHTYTYFCSWMSPKICYIKKNSIVFFIIILLNEYVVHDYQNINVITLKDYVVYYYDEITALMQNMHMSAVSHYM